MPAIDGVVTRLMRTLEELQQAGDEVVLIAPSGGPRAYAGVPVVGVRELRMPLYPDGDGYPPKRVSLPGPALARALRSFAPDLVHAINPVLLGAGAVALASRRRLALVASYHAHLPSYAQLYGLGCLEAPTWRYLRRLHNRAHVNLCTSRATLAQLAEHDVERLELWPWGIDSERFHPRAASPAWRRRLTGGRTERFSLLYVGRLAKEKTVERLLEAVRDREHVTLAIVGDGPLRAKLERQFAGTATTFLGFLKGEELAAAYASADAFVLPSQTETLGLVTLEARAAGLPVIAADSPAARELIADGVDGVRYDPGFPGSLAAAIERLRVDPARREDMSREARRSLEGASWREATAVLRRHYRTACQRARIGEHPPRPGTTDAERRPAIV